MKEMQVGVGICDITPEESCDLSGFLMRDNPSNGIHDHVFVRALALVQGDTTVLLIVCDLLGFELATSANMRELIAQATGVPRDHIMIACTHTHAAPASMTLIACGEPNTAWLAWLERQVVMVCVQALARLAPATLTSGAVDVPHVNANRRDVSGPVDRTVDIIRIDTESGPPTAFLVFGCHPVAAGPANRSVSSDIPGVIRERVEAATGGVALAATGACGDVNPSSHGAPPADLERGFALVNEVGGAVAEAALQQWQHLRRTHTSRIGVARIPVSLPLSHIPDSDELARLSNIYRAETDDPSWGAKGPTARRAWVMRQAAELQAGRLQPSVDADAQAFVLGDIAIVGLPGEIFAAHGLEIKRQSPVRHTIVVTYANGNPGYFPTRGSYPAGGYEVDDAYRFYGYPSVFAPEAGERLCAAALVALTAAKGE